MSTINDNDLFLVERAGTSHSVTSENLMSTIQDDDLMLVERGGVSYKVTGEDVKDQLGGPSGIIDAPVVVTSPKDGSGLTIGGKVTPAAEGITGVVESGSDVSLTYTTDNNLNLLTPGQSMTQTSEYSPQTDSITNVGTTPGGGSAEAPENKSWKSVTYGDGKFVAVATNGGNSVMYSSDGINWTSAQAVENKSWKSVTYGDGKFVAIAENGPTNVFHRCY